MIGTGITPEGINQNYILYDLMSEITWMRKPTNITNWLEKYILRRYGKIDDNITKAWNIFYVSRCFSNALKCIYIYIYII